MGKKRPLEFDLPSAEEEKAESRYERRLELKTSGGADHKEFSHETGTVRVDDTGLEEYRQREASEQAERLERARKTYSVGLETAREITKAYEPPEGWTGRATAAARFVRFGLTALVVYFAARILWNVIPFNAEFFVFLALAIGLALFVSSRNIPFRELKIAARLTYALLLIFIGVVGIWRLIDLYRHPPARGVNWTGFEYSALTVVASLLFTVLVGAVLRFAFRSRANVAEAIRDPEHSLVKSHPAFENREVLCALLYLIEGLTIVMVMAAISLLVLGLNFPLALSLLRTYPAATFFFIYPVMVHVFFRKVFLPAS